MPRIGIGIVTYNRRAVLQATVEKLRRFTSRKDVDCVVADDGSTDGTQAWLRDNGVPMVGGVNMGIAWNKNRALYLLAEMLGCETVVLLEDDTQPAAHGWETDWIEAAQRWGHANFAAKWMQHLFLSGTGTAADPILSEFVTAQCASYSRQSLLFAGYYDSRFKGYGHEHVEHTRRLVRLGYGGTERYIDGQEELRYKLIRGALDIVDVPSYHDAAQVERNLAIAGPLMIDQSFRAPWRDDAELRQFRSEMRSAIDAQSLGFGLHGPPPSESRGLAGRMRRLFGGR